MPHSNLTFNSNPAVSPDTPLRCSNQSSIYSNAVWVPIFGPWYDFAHNTHALKNTSWYWLSSLLPVFGPLAQIHFGETECLSACLSTPQAVLNSAESTNTEQLKQLLDQALQVSDRNCQLFLNRLTVADSPDAQGEFTNIEETGKLGIYLQQHLWPGLQATVQANRLAARKILNCAPPSQAQDVLTVLDHYDSLCSVASATAALLSASEHQNTANNTSSYQQQSEFLRSQGFNYQLTLTNEACVTPTQSAAAIKFKPNLNRRNHINNFFRRSQ
jgi:hypothetical protein